MKTQKMCKILMRGLAMALTLACFTTTLVRPARAEERVDSGVTNQQFAVEMDKNGNPITEEEKYALLNYSGTLVGIDNSTRLPVYDCYELSSTGELTHHHYRYILNGELQDAAIIYIPNATFEEKYQGFNITFLDGQYRYCVKNEDGEWEVFVLAPEYNADGELISDEERTNLLHYYDKDGRECTASWAGFDNQTNLPVYAFCWNSGFEPVYKSIYNGQLVAPSLRSDNPRYYDVTSFDCLKWSTYRREAEEAKIDEQIKASTTHTGGSSGNATFTDVNKGDWYYDAVTTLANAGILTGYEDGSFQPNKAITIGEMAALICRIDAGLTVETFDAANGVNNTLTTGRYGERTWTEPTSWAHDYIMTVRRTTGLNVQTGYIRWNPEAFGEPVTRGEAMRIAVEFARKTQTNVYVEIGVKNGDWVMFRHGKIKWREDALIISEDADMSQYIGDYNTLKRWSCDGFEQNTSEYWAAVEHFYKKTDIEMAYRLGIVHGVNENGDCNATTTITRAEFCQMLYNMGVTNSKDVGIVYHGTIDVTSYEFAEKSNNVNYYWVDGKDLLDTWNKKKLGYFLPGNYYVYSHGNDQYPINA